VRAAAAAVSSDGILAIFLFTSSAKRTAVSRIERIGPRVIRDRGRAGRGRSSAFARARTSTQAFSATTDGMSSAFTWTSVAFRSGGS